MAPLTYTIPDTETYTITKILPHFTVPITEDINITITNTTAPYPTTYIHHSLTADTAYLQT